MSGAHLHLLVNHVPILGFGFSVILLLLALVGRERDGWVRAALVLLGLSFLGVIAAYLSGDPAVTALEDMPRTSNLALEAHHDAAVLGTTACGLALAVVVVVAALHRHLGVYSRRSVLVLLASTLVAGGAMARTGLAGGRINHPEIQHAEDRGGEPVHEHEH